MFHIYIAHHASLQYNSILLLETKPNFFAVEIAKADFPQPPPIYQFSLFYSKITDCESRTSHGL